MIHDAKPLIEALRDLAKKPESLPMAALHRGIGLPRPAILTAPRAKLLSKQPVATPHVAMPAKMPSKFSENRSVPQRLKLFDRIFAHLFDLAVVLLTLMIGLVILGLAMEQASFQSLSEWLPVRILQKLSIEQLLAVVYASYLSYWVLFKILAGRTLGSFLFWSAQQKQVLKVTKQKQPSVQ